MALDSFAISKQSVAEFDIREDEEQLEKLKDTIDLLLAAGYFRARIKDLSPFDKVVGGMVWCITLCNRSIDVDLFYSENSTIGQKIALTERVVEVLAKLKCPHSIEPHQIQGLDFIHIFPVVQWLVKQAIEAKEKHGDSVRNHSVYQFNQEFGLPQDETERKEKENYVKNYRKIKSMCAPRRIYKRVHGFQCSDLRENVQCTLLEYGWHNIIPRKNESEEKALISSVGDARIETVERLQEQLSVKARPDKQRVSARALVQIIDTTGFDKATLDIEEISRGSQFNKEVVDNKLADCEVELAKLKEEEVQLQKRLRRAVETRDALKLEIVDTEQRIAENRGFFESVGNEEIEKFTQLLSEYDEIRKREANFKKNCNMELQKMDDELERLQMRISNPDSQTAVQSEEEKLNRARERLAAARLKAAELNKQIVLEQRHLDTIPSNVEISQYQRRIIELYNQMAHKHRQTKQLYTLHNTLLDVQTYRKREIDLLNSIEDVQDMASRESYKESFFENLHQIMKGVDASLDKIMTKQKELQATRDRVSDDYQYLLEKERIYHKTVDDFRNECEKNEEIRRKLKEMGREVDE